MTIELSGVGVWSHQLRYGEPDTIADAARELEELGYTAVWVPDVGGSVFEALDRLLTATTTITIATGILNVWQHTPQDVGGWWHGLSRTHQSRTLLGLGISHDAVVGDRYARPLATMAAYLDGLADVGVPLGRTCLAALGPRMLELAATRTAGAHPYLVTTEHTATARGILGAGLLAVEQTVALDTNLEAARESARAMLRGYAMLPNYAGNWRRLGFSDDDIDKLDDALVDALVACGDTAAVAARLDAQRRAGADHVCVQVLTASREEFPRPAWRALAPAQAPQT